MEYIKKEELKDGDIFVSQMSHHHFLNKYGTGYSLHLNLDNTIKNQVLYRNGGFAYNNMRLATSEEKHWLNECIKLDKFITFEEAMKTFITEYVEAISNKHSSSEIIGTIYKTSELPKWVKGHKLEEYWKAYMFHYKPSTKEVYNAQFVVKEPEFVLPEKWCLKITKENLDFCKSLENNELKFHKNYPYSIGGYYSPIPNKDCNGFINIPENYTEITFEQFKKYVLKEEIVEEVIEPLPPFKVIESIETITKVENNEGNQFFIGDIVKCLNGIIQTIESFDYNKAKTNIIAFTNKQSILGIGIDKIEHYIEPKTDYKILEYKTEGGISCKAPFLADSHQFYINERYKIYSIKRISDDLIITVGDEVLGKTCGVPNKILSIELINNKIRLYPRNSFYNLEDIIKVKDETLLEKAKRLYPIGTKFKSAISKRIFTIKNHIQEPCQDPNTIVFSTNEINTSNKFYACVHSHIREWAEIIE